MFDRINTTCPNCGSSALVNFYRADQDAVSIGYIGIVAECLDCFLTRDADVRFDTLLELFRVTSKRRPLVQNEIDVMSLGYRPSVWKPLTIAARRSPKEYQIARADRVSACIFRARISHEDYFLTEVSVRNYWIRKAQIGDIPEFRALSSMILSGDHPVIGLDRFNCFSSALSELVPNTLEWCLVPFDWYPMSVAFLDSGVRS